MFAGSQETLRKGVWFDGLDALKHFDNVHDFSVMYVVLVAGVHGDYILGANCV